jgi:hypothetical protein
MPKSESCPAAFAIGQTKPWPVVADAVTGQVRSTWTMNDIIKRKERAWKRL